MEQNKIVIANWKMKRNLAETTALLKEFKAEFKDFGKEDAVICPNFISLLEAKKVFEETKLKLGAQAVFWEDKGSFTGEISATMLTEVGCEYVIVGHSERRQYLLTNYEMIHKKTRAVLRVKGLTPIICIGEQAEDRKSDRRDFILIQQIQQSLAGIEVVKGENIIIAYEPVWAVGAGTTLEPEEAEYAHKIIKLALNDMFGMKTVNESFRIIYGGSINSENVEAFIKEDNLDGFLVGGASLDAKEFKKIVDKVL